MRFCETRHPILASNASGISIGLCKFTLYCKSIPFSCSIVLFQAGGWRFSSCQERIHTFKYAILVIVNIRICPFFLPTYYAYPHRTMVSPCILTNQVVVMQPGRFGLAIGPVNKQGCVSGGTAQVIYTGKSSVCAAAGV